ncbi:MAG: hypothetical protein AAF684_10700, partial [Pseudomonadota bacterium]
MPKWNATLIHILVQVGGWALMAAALLVTYDVVTRKILGISIAGADEISGYVFAGATGETRLKPGECMKIATGAPLPPGAD